MASKTATLASRRHPEAPAVPGAQRQHRAGAQTRRTARAGGADWQNITYEGYGPNGVAVLIECSTDNRNRAAGEVRVAMTRNGGNMADPGSVSYLFSREVSHHPEERHSRIDTTLLAVLGASAEEVNDLDEAARGHLATDLVRTALRDAGIDTCREASLQPSDRAGGSEENGAQVDASGDSDDAGTMEHEYRHLDDVAAQLDAEPVLGSSVLCGRAASVRLLRPPGLDFVHPRR